ncbi:MAG: opioid growth factor receptor-related protein [Gemmatimonadota bacterium]
MPTPLVAFYRHQGTDHAGRLLRQVWEFSHEDLERRHDFIQWLFPLPEPSGVLPQAPRLTQEAIDAFAADESLRDNLRHLRDIMLGFYGFNGQDGALVPAPDSVARRAVWLTRGNHNLLRLTRMLRSLTLLDEVQSARTLLAALEAIAAEQSEVVGATTLGYWRRAVGSVVL